MDSVFAYLLRGAVAITSTGPGAMSLGFRLFAPPRSPAVRVWWRPPAPGFVCNVQQRFRIFWLPPEAAERGTPPTPGSVPVCFRIAFCVLSAIVHRDPRATYGPLLQNDAGVVLKSPGELSSENAKVSVSFSLGEGDHSPGNWAVAVLTQTFPWSPG